MPRAKPVEIFDFDLTIVVDLTIGVDLTIDYDVISDLTDDSWKSGDWCWLIPEKNDDEVIDLTKDDDEISYLTNDDDETNESRGKKQTK